MKTRTRSALALAIGALLAAPAAAEDLLAVFRQARGYDAAYAAAKAALDAGREKRPQGLALLLPTVNASANTAWNEVQNKTTNRDFNFNTHSWQVQLTQPIFRWQNIVQFQQSDFQVMQAEAQFANATQDLILRVAQAYFDVLSAQDNLEFTRAQKRAIAEQLAQAKRNFEVGTATITDTNEAQARFDLVIAQEIAAINDLEVKRRSLQLVIGRLPDRLATLRPGVLIEVPGPTAMDTWLKAAEAQNYNVRVQEAAWEIAKREVERQRAGHYPTVDGVITAQNSLGANTQLTGVRNEFDQQVYALQFNLPLYAGGAVLSRTREAASLAEKARQDLENAKRTANLDASRSFLSVTNGLAQVKALEQALASSETSLQSNKVGYEVGVRINIDVLNAEQQVTSTRRDLAKARYDTILNGLRLKAAVGALSEEDLERVNTLLGPEQPLTQEPLPVVKPPELPQAPLKPAAPPAKTN